jgi:hypothetical protein
MKRKRIFVVFYLKKNGQNIKPTAVDGIHPHTDTHDVENWG